MIIDKIEHEALEAIRATDPETARRFLYILDLLEKKSKHESSSYKDLTEAVKDLIYYSGIMYQEKKQGTESIGNIIMRL